MSEEVRKSTFILTQIPPKQKKVKKEKVPKEPGLLRQVIAVAYERAMTRRALRLLNKQEWSVEFLTVLLVRASRLKSEALQLTVHSAEGLVMKITSLDALTSTPVYKDDSIFNHLDDEVKVRQFIKEANKR